MTDKKYSIFVFTYWCALVQFLIGIIIPMVILFSIHRGSNVIVFFIAFAAFNILGWYLVREYFLQPIDIVINEDRLKLFYYNFNHSKEKKAKYVLTEKISGFSDFSNGRDLKFKLLFKAGGNFTLYKSGIWYKKDDFELLQRDFKSYIENYNSIDKESSNRVEKQKIKYGDNTYLTFAIILLIPAFLLGFQFVESIFSENGIDNKKMVGFLFLLIFGLVNLSMHLKWKKKNKNK